jgi:putative Mg2+ transporter-C (MgtC) family protein
MISFPTILLRLCLAVVLGALIGWERERTEHTAGLRTNALVALGSALFMVISAYGFNAFLGEAHIQVDPSRVASYVVAGIGFLAGGSIFFSQDREKVRGLTTAAAVWIDAAIGLACGIGLLLEGVAVTVLTLLVLIGFRYLERLAMPKHAPHLYEIQVEVAPGADGQQIGQLYDICTQAGVKVTKLKVHANEQKEVIELGCYTSDSRQLTQVMSELKALASVSSVQVDMSHMLLLP